MFKKCLMRSICPSQIFKYYKSTSKTPSTIFITNEGEIDQINWLLNVLIFIKFKRFWCDLMNYIPCNWVVELSLRMFLTQQNSVSVSLQDNSAFCLQRDSFCRQVQKTGLIERQIATPLPYLLFLNLFIQNGYGPIPTSNFIQTIKVSAEGPSLQLKWEVQKQSY